MQYYFQLSGKITYNGHELHEFCVQRTSAYISQTDNHIAELTVRETLDFGARCEGEGFAGLSFLFVANYIWLFLLWRRVIYLV